MMLEDPSPEPAEGPQEAPQEIPAEIPTEPPLVSYAVRAMIADGTGGETVFVMATSPEEAEQLALATNPLLVGIDSVREGKPPVRNDVPRWKTK